MTPVGGFVVAADHPALAGHFPGAPVLPGVVLLDHVLAAVGGDGLPQVKFLHPVRPGDTVAILAGPEQGGRVAFACQVGDREVARGTISVGPRR